MSADIVAQCTERKSAGGGLRILVAEDEPSAQKFLSIILQNFKFSVEIASDGHEVIEKVKKKPYDLILMDLQMPVMGGIETTKIIREQLHKTMPILTLTATEDGKGKCLAAGMNDYLVKPIEISQLKDKILYWIKGVSQGVPANRKETNALKWDKQGAIKALGVPEGLYRELMRGFIRRFASGVRRLEKAFQDRNFEKIAKEAHFIKGAAGNLRIQEIYVTAKAMEVFAKGDQDAGMIAKQIGRLKSAMEELKKNK